MEELLKALLTTPEGVSAIINQYKPLIYSVAGELFGLYKDLVDNDEYYKYNAKNHYKKFMALVNEGFTEQQAMKILLSDINNFKNAFGNSVKVKK